MDHPTLSHFFQSCVQFKQREWNRIDNKEEGGGRGGAGGLGEKVNRFGVRSDTPSLEEVRKEEGKLDLAIERLNLPLIIAGPESDTVPCTQWV